MSDRLMQITIVDKEIHHLLPGEVTLSDDRKYWFVCCPLCKGPGSLSGHQSTYDEGAGLLTISPSLLCGCGAHYFIVNNEIRWCT